MRKKRYSGNVYYPEHLKEPLVLKQGKKQGYDYKILTTGNHPTAYVNLSASPYFSTMNLQQAQNYFMNNSYCLHVHGGITFVGRMGDTEDIWIGWDYMHPNDFSGVYGTGSRAYTVTDIFEDVKNCIYALSCFGSKY